MFERRLYFHIDWLLLGAILLLAGIGVGDDLQHDLRHDRGRRPRGPRSSGPRSTRSASALVALLVCLTIDYRMLAEHSLFIYGGLSRLLVFVLSGVDADAAPGAGSDSAPSTCSRPSLRGSRWR